jgi:zinc transport system permease protein
VGTYVVSRRITAIAGSIAHCVLGGLGIARWLQTVHHLDWLHPLYGAVVAALLAAVLIGWVSIRAKRHEDTVISAIWAIGMAIGILFIFKTPGYNEDLLSYLFGNILLVTDRDLWMIAGLDLVIIAVSLVFYNPFLAICFDEEFARLRGISVEAYYILLLCLTALTVVLLITVVGIILVIALLTLPAAIAGEFSRKLWHMMILATVTTVLLTTGGLVVSYGPDLPAGATTIVLAGAAYLLAVLGKRLFHAGRVKNAAQDLPPAGDHDRL